MDTANFSSHMFSFLRVISKSILDSLNTNVAMRDSNQNKYEQNLLVKYIFIDHRYRTASSA